MTPRRLGRFTGVAAAILLAGFVVYAVVSSGSRPTGSFPAVASPSQLRPGRAAPAFRLSRLGGGPAVVFSAGRLSSVVSFFASWCTDCRAELRAFAAVSHQARGVRFVGVDADDPSPRAALQLVRRAGISYSIGVDPSGSVTDRYLVSALPVTFFVTAGGRVAGELFGTARTSELAAWVHRLGGSTRSETRR